MWRIPWPILALAAAFVPTTAAAVQGKLPPALEVTLRPVASAEDRAIEAVDVTIELDPTANSKPKFRLPLVASNVETIAGSLTRVEAQDSKGVLSLATRQESEGESAARVWEPTRVVEGKMTLRYRAPLETRLAPRGAGPPLELRSNGAAFSGAGSTFLLLPQGDEAHRIRVHWDLAALPYGSIAVSSVDSAGEGVVLIEPASHLERSFFMAGTIGIFRVPAEAEHFRAAWQGQPPFDANRLMGWASQLHARFVKFFRVKTPSTYTIFLRPNLVNPGGGVGLNNAFVATFDANTDGESLKLTVAHEMFHTFAPSLDAPKGLESSWFGEGLATHYQRVLPFRFGLIDADEFLENLNSTAARYYTSTMAKVPNSEVPARFWEDTRIRTLPYDRGALYFAELNHRLKLRTNGKRSLDDLVLAMVERQRQGQELSYDDWEELLSKELGSDGVEQFRSMLAGQQPLPDSSAFGPCFRRTIRLLRRYELGFDPKVLVEPPRIVRGLVPGSAAELTGLRNGDEIVRPVPQDRIQGDQYALLHLEIRRGDAVIPIAYLPRGETVEAWQWERAPGREAGCEI